MNVERLVDDRRVEFGVALGEEGRREHVEIARVDHVGLFETVTMLRRQLRAPEDRLDPLKIGGVERAAQVDILPFGRHVIAAAHREADDIKAIVAKALYAPAHGCVGGVMSEEGDARHRRNCLQAVGL